MLFLVGVFVTAIAHKDDPPYAVRPEVAQTKEERDLAEKTARLTADEHAKVEAEDNRKRNLQLEELRCGRLRDKALGGVEHYRSPENTDLQPRGPLVARNEKRGALTLLRSTAAWT